MLNDEIESADFDGIRLSEVDEDLICLAARGLTDAEIAAQLEVPKHVVVDHMAELLSKLGAHERVELLLYAFSKPALCQRINAKPKTKGRQAKAS